MQKDYEKLFEQISLNDEKEKDLIINFVGSLFEIAFSMCENIETND